jgi:hypothetical protein
MGGASSTVAPATLDWYECAMYESGAGVAAEAAPPEPLLP